MAISNIDDAPGVESPCLRICALDDDDICVGCFRSLDEICAWSLADDRARREIVERAGQRRSRARDG